MNAQRLHMAGIAVATGGLLLLIIGLASAALELDLDHSPWRFVLLAAPFLAAVGAVGVLGLSRGQRGAQAGAVLMLGGGLSMGTGLGLVSYTELAVGWNLMWIGVLISAVGLTVFGWFNRQARLLAVANGLPLACGGVSVVGMLWQFTQEARRIPWDAQSNIPFFLLITGLALGWICLGYALWRTAGVERQTPELAA